MLSWFKRFFQGRSATRHGRGRAGERHAEVFLRRERGFGVVARNWRSPRDRRDEIDLVCRDAETLVFVEVKTRAPNALVPGYYAVNRRKRRAVKRACMAYLRLLERKPATFRFDVVEVELAPDSTLVAVHHFENIPLFAKFYTGE